MHRRILVVPTGQREPVTAVCLGLVQALSEMRVDVGYAKPIAQDYGRGNEDQSLEVFRMATRLRPPQSTPSETALHELAHDGMDLMLAGVVLDLADVLNHEAVVFEGLSPLRESVSTMQLNRELATALDADVLLVASASESGLDSLPEQAIIAARPFLSRLKDRVLGVFVEGYPEGEEYKLVAVRSELAHAGLDVVATMPQDAKLDQIRVGDLVHRLRLDVLSTGDLSRRIKDTIVAAQALPNVAEFVASSGRLIVTPGDRNDVLMAAALAEMRDLQPAGIVLTGGLRPSDTIWDLCLPALDAGLPVLATEELTFEAASAMAGMADQIPADDEERANNVKMRYAAAFTPQWLREQGEHARPARATYAKLRAGVTSALSTGRYTIAMPGPVTPMQLAVAERLKEIDVALCLFVDTPDAIRQVAESSGTPMPESRQIADPSRPSGKVVRFVEEKRGVGPAEASEALADPTLHALALLGSAEVQGMVGGLPSPESPLLDLADELIGRTEGPKVRSSTTILMDHVCVTFYGDTVFNENPSAEEIACGAEATANCAVATGVAPTVKFVCGSHGVPVDQAEFDLMTEARDLLITKRPDLSVQGPMHIDEVSDDPEDSGVRSGGGFVGNANCLIFPNARETQVALATERLRTHAGLAGPLIHGYDASLNWLPDTATVSELIDTIGMTALLVDRD